jgi:molecular chaperone DnaK
MAGDNKTLGKFNLDGIPPAPRGMPQVEVTFDIDANGIVHVSAKDKATGKEQKIRIESSSGLQDDEIERMVREAEDHREADEAKRERVEARNKAESMLHQSRKTLSDLEDKIDDEQKSGIEEKITALETALQGDDADRINEAVGELEGALHAVAEQIYQAQAGGAEGAAGAAGAGAAPGAEAGGDAADDDDVIDAEFEEAN